MGEVKTVATAEEAGSEVDSVAVAEAKAAEAMEAMEEATAVRILRTQITPINAVDPRSAGGMQAGSESTDTRSPDGLRCTRWARTTDLEA
jgi:hypothetical protein